MFDSALCDRTLTKLPLYLSGRQYPWLKPTLIAVILLLAFFGIRWVIQHTSWRRWLSSRRVILSLFGFTACLPLIFFLADKALVAFLPPDPGTPADSIVVIGRGWQFFQRFDLAAELWKAKRAPNIFISGVNDAPIGIELLQKQGIPLGVLDGENCSLTTDENAVFTASVLQPQGIKRILLVTDPPHMWRSLLVFRAQGFTVIPKPSPLPSYLGRKAETFITLREYMGLVGYGLRGLFFPQRSPGATRPDLINLLRKAEQYGKQQRLQ